MTWKIPPQPFEQSISEEDWAKQCELYGFRPYERTFIHELIAFYKLNKPRKSEGPPIPPAKTKIALRSLRAQALKSWTALRSKPNAMSEQQAADVESAVSKLIRECEKTEGEIPSRPPGRNAELLKLTISILHMFMILQTGKKISRSYKVRTDEFAIWFFGRADPTVKESTIRNAIKEYLRGWGKDEARYLLGEDKDFNRAFEKRLQMDPIEEYLRGWGEDEARYEEFHRAFEKRLQMHKHVLHQNFLNPEGLEKWLAALERKDIVEIIAALGSETIDKLKKRIAGPEVATDSSR